MCRLFGYVGKSHGDVELLYDNLKKCAANDVLANELGKRQIHKDGWGYVMLSDSGLVHYRSQTATSCLEPAAGLSQCSMQGLRATRS